MTQEKDPVLYEATYLIKVDDDQKAAEKAEAFRGLVEKSQGIIASQNQPSLKTLGYPIKKETSAYWGWIKFMARPGVLAELEEHLKSDSSILRFMIVRAGEEKVERVPRRRKQPVATPTTAPEDKTDVKEIDKKLEEILGE